MKRCLTLGISLCLIGLLSGCCCGQRCGLFRGGCYAPSPCNPCAQPLGFAPLGGNCNSCGTGGYVNPGYPSPYGGGVPAGYIVPNGLTSATPDSSSFNMAATLPPSPEVPVAAYGQPMFDQTAYAQPGMAQPTLGQPGAFNASPVTTAQLRPESLSTY